MAVVQPAPEGGLLSHPERQWRAAICLGWPLAIGAVPVLMAAGGSLCAFRHLSGLPCPLCGGTHACAALLQGDLAAAWQANPGLLPLLAVAAVHTGLLAGEALVARSFGPRRPWSRAWGGGGMFLLACWGLRLLGYV